MGHPPVRNGTIEVSCCFQFSVATVIICKFPSQGVKAMPRKSLGLVLTAILVFCNLTLRAQEEQPLGDVVRQARAAKASQPKASKVITNDDLRPQLSTNQVLDDDTARYCEVLTLRRDPGAKDDCAVLRIDMGSEYQETVAQSLWVKERLCEAERLGNPIDPELLKRASQLHTAFQAIHTKQIEAVREALKALGFCSLQKEQDMKWAASQASKQLGLQGAEVQMLNAPGAIQAKYDKCMKERQARYDQEHLRSSRMALDSLRLLDSCP